VLALFINTFNSTSAIGAERPLQHPYCELFRILLPSNEKRNVTFVVKNDKCERYRDNPNKRRKSLYFEEHRERIHDLQRECTSVWMYEMER